MKISLVITIFNEESTLDLLLTAIKKQTQQIDELIIVDGGSTDRSWAILKTYQQQKFFKNKLKIYQKTGNRSTGRNLAIKKTTNELIAITDAGCIPNKDWLEKLVKKQHQTQAPVVAGYYYGLAKNNFQQAVIPYVLVMPDKIDHNFLPATRSMLISKKTWQEVGGFNEQLNHNEDYAFAKELESRKIKIAIAQAAQVAWLPRKNLWSFIVMIYRFALGDAEAEIFRPKVGLILARYFLLILVLFFSLLGLFFPPVNFLTSYGLTILLLAIISYGSWAIAKNKKYVVTGWWWLPLLQISADLAVITGTVTGSLKKLN
ncbi:MAG: glycosyltransferase [Patescibacteria group bacterium]